VAAGLPVISVDAKRKELIGNFKNGGRAWSKEAEAVNVHDFPQDVLGRAVPDGIYDMVHLERDAACPNWNYTLRPRLPVGPAATSQPLKIGKLLFNESLAAGPRPRVSPGRHSRACNRHSRESGSPGAPGDAWMHAEAGMTGRMDAGSGRA
jgi:hypothetical protein